MNLSHFKQTLLVSAGVISMGLGIAGVFLPLLPTTPFMLLAAACFIRSSDRMYQWLTNHKWFGGYIKNYREHRAISLRAKIIGVSLLWVTIGYAMIWVVEAWWLRALLGMIVLIETRFILRLKTLSAQKGKSGDEIAACDDCS